ncbi:alpha/beta fold hydrolase [Streptomyces sp. TRM68367]|uniref:alpha/beta fold hydrolase n=1 Tax=Streptomyces sp. TRM68367 TaxID=2758415 RepID=UPI00165BD428|nr:alpha/beta hydrolase [Streptomyces sp. TRM68367]MBC9730663.1 alpha/beta hydrolase [Streptomyces sp. TRM68367]
MPVAAVNGIRLHYDDVGSGDPVVMVMGTAGSGRVWHMHQVPALKAAGYRVITFDNRGIPPTDECPEGFTVGDLVADTAGLVEHLGLGPVRLVGTSMGAYVVQELALARPELVHQAVLMAGRGRSDATRAALARAEIELHDSGVELPSRYRAVVQALQSLSPSTLDDDQVAADWIDIFEMARREGPGIRAQMALEPMPDRISAYSGIRVPCHVISFADDLTTPPRHGRELADIIPGATFDLIEKAGHYGYLEVPEEVNKSILEFFAGTRAGAP